MEDDSVVVAVEDGGGCYSFPRCVCDTPSGSGMHVRHFIDGDLP